MKITDLAIIFILCFVIFQVIFEFKSEELIKQENCYVSMNNICDNAIEDALAKGYGGVDINGKPLIDYEKVREYFIKEVDYIVNGNTLSARHDEMENKIIMIIATGEEGFCIYDGGWQPVVSYDSDKHEIKSEQIISYVNNNLKSKGCYIDVPASLAESYAQSFSRYGVYIIWDNTSERYKANNCRNYVFSGAAIKKKE